MIRISLLSLCLLLETLCVATPVYDFDKIDAHARATPAKYSKDVSELAAYLTRPARNDHEKVRSFYVWLAENIAYDVDLFRSYRPGTSLNMEPVMVLNKRKAVCQGYADLFNALCEEVGIKSVLVPGYSKGFGNANRTDFSNADHAWNSVLLDGKWHLLDATWGAGGLDDKMRYKAVFNEKYFLTKPEEFVLDHMPLQPMWQLLDCPVSMKAFAAGSQAVEKELSATKNCEPFEAKIDKYEQMDAPDKKLYAAQEAYRFNPANHLVMGRGYMDKAHQIMSGIQRQMSSKAEIEAAVKVQEESLAYLIKAREVLNKAGKKAKMEIDFVNKNIRNGQENLKAMKAILSH